MKNRRFVLLVCLTLITAFNPTLAQKHAQPSKVSFLYGSNFFPLVYQGRAATLYIDKADAEVVKIAGAAWCKDIHLLTGISPDLSDSLPKEKPFMVIAGTLGSSALIKQLVENKKISVQKVKGEWETFSIIVVNHPFKNVEQALVVYGSDPRGTAFGLFELSRLLGVSPFYWWADVNPEHHENLFITPGESIVGPPSVKYRGVFLNDEDWGLRPWAAKHMDADKKDIGPRAYEKIFELLLRLKANYLWPAMHPGTKAFWYYKENPELARKYSIIMGSSHHEPMLRNTEFEWNENYKEEYGKAHGEWRYDLNKNEIYQFFDDRVKESKGNEAIYTVGMRATKDGAMAGPENTQDKVKILENVIADQRKILTTRLNTPANQIPQVFCPYKEVLPLYRAGLKLPEDVTILWVDDNHGYIRQLPNPSEQQRSGGSGVYYHFSYWGTPEDYLWLSSISPSLIAYEMNKAYHFNAKKMWVFNVGDLKPAEMEMQFALDMAWNVERWSPFNAHQYALAWAAETFGPKYAQKIAAIKASYYQLASSGKPEHVDKVTFTPSEISKRLKNYQQLDYLAQSLETEIPKRLKDAYYQLILYPVKGAKLMNEKIFFAQRSLDLAKHGDWRALRYSRKSQEAYDKIQALTRKYNDTIAGGKWSGMMDASPRDARVYHMPRVADKKMIKVNRMEFLHPPLSAVKKTISAAAYYSKKEAGGAKIRVIDGLGVGGKGITVLPYLLKSFSLKETQNAPNVCYQTRLNAGIHQLTLKCLPTFRIYDGFALRYGVQINNGSIQIIDLSSFAETKSWENNVLRGYTQGINFFRINAARKVTIKIYFLDPGLVLNEIAIN